jgi:hypothetical protein
LHGTGKQHGSVVNVGQDPEIIQVPIKQVRGFQTRIDPYIFHRL